MKNAKKELLVLWKMEITSVISKKKENIFKKGKKKETKILI